MHIRSHRNYWLFLQTEWGISQSLDKDECKEEEPHTKIHKSIEDLECQWLRKKCEKMCKLADSTLQNH